MVFLTTFLHWYFFLISSIKISILSLFFVSFNCYLFTKAQKSVIQAAVHRADVIGLSPQEFSSLPSVQSSSPSHSQTDRMQRPFAHWNWLASHSVFVPTNTAEQWQAFQWSQFSFSLCHSLGQMLSFIFPFRPNGSVVFKHFQQALSE